MDYYQWTQGLPNRRLYLFYRKRKYTDCSFIIKGQKYKAHKLILASCSPVFETMFYGDLASNEIKLEDIEAEQLRQMLKYIYTGNLKMSSLTEAWAMFYVAKKYILDDLIKICLRYISDNLCISGLVLSYEYCELYNLDKLKQKCFRDTLHNLNAIFTTDYHMKPTTLKRLLSKQFLLTNIDVTNKIIEWAVVECEHTEVPVSPENIVELLQRTDILQFINKTWLSQMKCEYCTKSVVHCTCVEEIVQKTIMHLYCQVVWEFECPPHSKIVNFGIRARRVCETDAFYCETRDVYKISQRLDLKDDEEFVCSVSVNRPLVVSGMFILTELYTGVPLPYPKEYKGSLSVRFCEHESDKNLVKPTIINGSYSYDSQVFIPLRYAITLTPELNYDIKIGFKNFVSANGSTIICNYMSKELIDETKLGLKMQFYDTCGSVIKGVLYYPK